MRSRQRSMMAALVEPGSTPSFSKLAVSIACCNVKLPGAGAVGACAFPEGAGAAPI